jgi:hypothetical protein
METGFVSTGLNETDTRIFVLERVPLPVSATLVAVAVANNTLVVVFDTPQILRIDLLQGDQIECKYTYVENMYDREGFF